MGCSDIFHLNKLGAFVHWDMFFDVLRYKIEYIIHKRYAKVNPFVKKSIPIGE